MCCNLFVYLAYYYYWQKSILLKPGILQIIKDIFFFIYLTFFLQGGFLSSLVGMGFMIALMSTPDDGKNTKTRLGYLLSFAFLSGKYYNIGQVMKYTYLSYGFSEK